MKPIYQRILPEYCKKHFEENMFNKKFGHLRVLGISSQSDSTNVHFLICLCDCGKIFHTRKRNVLEGRTKSCCNYVSKEEDIERFKSKVVINKNDCWLWNGGRYKRKNGNKSYGRFETKLFPEEYLAHRISFLLFKGPIPESMFICHICDVENCVNPDHLFIGTAEANIKDMILKNRQASGENNGSSKLKEYEVLAIRKSYSNGISLHDLAEKYNVYNTCIYKVIKRESWKHI